MPFMEGQDLSRYALRDWSVSFPSREMISRLLVEFLSPLAERVASLHDANIVHRDIKPNNVFCSTADGVVLLDFGRANYLTGAAPRTDHGTLGFFPPEMVDPEATNEDPRSDVYGFGATCFSLLSGRKMILFGGMRDPSKMLGFDFMFVKRETVISEYLEGLGQFAGRPFGELLGLLNFPLELKETNLGRYLARLFHPNREERPANMHRVAEEVRRLGGEFATLEIWAPLPPPAGKA
jgi:serine/threonine protein kinase